VEKPNKKTHTKALLTSLFFREASCKIHTNFTPLISSGNWYWKISVP